MNGQANVERAEPVTRVTVRKYGAEAVAAATAQLGHDPCGDELQALGVDPYAVVEIGHPANRLVTVGLAALRSRLLTTAPVWAASSAGSGVCCLGIGSGTTGDVIGDTDISGGSKTYKQLDDGYILDEGGYLKVKATMGATEANHLWANYGLFVPSAGAAALSGAAVSVKPANRTMFNHKSPAINETKGAGEAWSWEYWIELV